MSNNPGVQSAFPIVVFGAVAVSVVMSVVLLFSRENVHDEIGQGGISREGELTGAQTMAEPDSPAGLAERELEVRQMLGARSRRLVRAGQPALDIDAEVARLLEPAQGHDAEPGLTEEVRQLVVARNERRVRRGLEPLEVEAEVARTLEELGG
jgi:hypothetical protein